MQVLPRKISSEPLACLFLFLFPLLGNSVRSWTGLFFVGLLILGMTLRPWRHFTLEKSERQSLIVLASIFVVIVVSGLVNGWSENQTRGFGVYVRYLAFVPIYFLLRSVPSGLKAFAMGCAIGAIVLFAQGLYDVLWLQSERAYGVYDSPGLFAGQAVVFALISVLLLFEAPLRSWERYLGVLGLVCALLAIGLSGSRSTFLALLLLGVVVLFWISSWRKRLIWALAIGLTSGLLYSSLPMVGEQVSRGIQEVKVYLSHEDPTLVQDHGSVGQRLEMWRVSALIIAESPLLGVGWRGFGAAAQAYVHSGQAHATSALHPHPHNTYLEFFVSIGVVGFALLLAWWLLAARQLLQHRVEHPLTCRVAGVFLLFMAFSAINEGGLFIYGNSLSFYLMAYGFFMAAIRRPLA